MSVTVADLLRLPSLRGAKVVGGRGGLGKIVASISVLESTDPGVLVDEVFPQGEFYGSEIVITGFLNSIDNVPLQCANLRRLAEGGEVGLILYYVGVYLPRVDPRLIQLADELDFVLICMPEGDANLRYGEVINDVMECIFRDRAQNNSIVLEILARVSALPRHQQTVNTALKMLSDRLSASVVLCDGAFHILNLVAWPRSLEGAVKAGVEAGGPLPPPGESAPCPYLPEGRVYRVAVRPDSGQPLELLLIKAGLPLESGALAQIADVTRTCINIWGRRHGEVALHELVRAILQDEPMKMRRLAEIFRIDIAAIHEMWLMAGGEEAQLERLAGPLRDCLAGFSASGLVDLYEGRLLMFLRTPASQQEAERMAAALLEAAARELPAPLLTRCGGLENTAQVRQAYLCYQEYLADARRIYPDRRLFTLGELEFARDCRLLIQSGEAALEQCLALLRPVQTDNDEMDLAGTLAAFLLDGEASVTLTAERLFLHKNTVKYRLRRIADALGYRPDRMPRMLELYRAVAVRRLL